MAMLNNQMVKFLIHKSTSLAGYSFYPSKVGDGNRMEIGGGKPWTP
jgi:hypothetical protein